MRTPGPNSLQKPVARPLRAAVVGGAPALDETGLLPSITDIPEDRNFVSALARGLAVLHSFSDRKRHMSIADVSNRTGIPRATVRRSLYTLEKLGYVDEDDARRFFLRPKVLSFGHAYLSATPLALLAQPVLDRLSDKIHEPCSLAVMERDEIIYVARSTSSRIMSPALNVGRRLPAYCTSIGRIVLAFRPDADLENYLARVQFQAFTPHTVTSREELRRMFKSARQAGYATADQQMEPHFRTMAVPVRDTLGAVVAGINVIIQNERWSLPQMASRFLAPLQAAAGELGGCLLP
jgi:IclR family pca regulon transcriptional regulator